MNESIKTIHWTKYIWLPKKEKVNYIVKKSTGWGFPITYIEVKPFNSQEWTQEINKLINTNIIGLTKRTLYADQLIKRNHTEPHVEGIT